MNKISFNLKDFNINNIKRQSKLGNLKTRNPYRVFGMKEGSKAAINLYYDANNFKLDNEIKELKQFFQKNKLSLFIASNDKDSEKIAIGLRRDLRGQIKLSGCILSTIIYKLEKRLNLDMDFEIAGIPHFS